MGKGVWWLEYRVDRVGTLLMYLLSRNDKISISLADFIPVGPT